MEYSLTVIILAFGVLVARLNPCSNGILSDLKKDTQVQSGKSLNPCSNGILSDNVCYCCVCWKSCLNPCSNGILSDKKVSLLKHAFRAS